MAKLPKITKHYGNCDFCKARHVPVVHYNYDEQPKNDFRLCFICLKGGLNYLIPKE